MNTAPPPTHAPEMVERLIGRARGLRDAIWDHLPAASQEGMRLRRLASDHIADLESLTAALQSIDKAGFVIVPREATEAMIEAGARSVAPNIVDVPRDAGPAWEVEEQMRDHVLTEAEQTWRAMLAAASPVSDLSCPNCRHLQQRLDAVDILVGDGFANSLHAALDFKGAPRKSPDGGITYGLVDRIGLLNSRGAP